MREKCKLGRKEMRKEGREENEVESEVKLTRNGHGG